MPVHLLHVAAQIDTPGGMGAIIRRHRAREPQSAFVGLFDRPHGPGPGATSHLGARAWTSPQRLRTDFQATVAVHPRAEVAIYHNAWGAAWFAGLDGAGRRVAFLHTDLPDLENFLTALRGQFDGIICLSRAMREVCLVQLPELAAERCLLLSYPIGTPLAPFVLDRPRGQPLLLGYAGRLEQKQKRLDRVAPFLARLDALRVEWRFEFLGDGPMRATLERQFWGDPRVTFLGWREGADYWRALANWDAIIFFSDYEASPLALQEAMAVGVLPFFPRLGRTQAEIDAAAVDPRGVYPAGDLAAAAEQLRQVFGESAAALASLRATASALVQPRHGNEYEPAFLAWIALIARSPRLSVDRARGGRLGDHLPIGLLARFWPHVLHA